MASPGDRIFWPSLDGSKRWPKGPIEPLDGYIPNSLDNSVAHGYKELQKAMASEPERYASANKPTRWQRLKRLFR